MKNNKLIKLFLVLALVISSALGCVYAFSFRNMTLDFVQISDTHITNRADTSYKALSSSKDLLKDAINQINNMKGLDFVLFTGDMVDNATEENFENYYTLLKRLKYPSLNAFGNHDFYGNDKETVLDIVKKNNPNYTFNDTYYAFSPKTDYRIIILDSTIKDANTANGELSQEQLDFLDSELAQNKDKIVLIAMHHPSVEPFASSDHTIVNANQFNEILLKYKNPIIVVSGHYHASKIRRMGNLVFVSTPAMVTYPMAFRRIKIVNFKDRVEYKFDFYPTRLDDVKEENRQSVVSYGVLAGMEKDREQDFIFRKRFSRSASYKRNKIKNSTKERTISKKEARKLTTQNQVKTKTSIFEKYHAKIQDIKEKLEQKRIEKAQKPKKERVHKSRKYRKTKGSTDGV